jgi:hypothetical protein
MKDQQNKNDVKPRITTKDGEEVKPPAVTGNETDKPITGTPPKRDMVRSGTQPTRDDGDNDDKGELA